MILLALVYLEKDSIKRRFHVILVLAKEETVTWAQSDYSIRRNDKIHSCGSNPPW